MPPSVFSPTTVLGSNSLSSSLSTYGVDGTIVWVDDFTNVNSWQPDQSSFINIDDYSGKSNDSIFTLSASGNAGSKIVLFYKITLPSPIRVLNDESVFIKFKTASGTRLLVNLVYNDGTMSNTVYSDTVYMNSSIVGLYQLLI